jgi:hypothetical protein
MDILTRSEQQKKVKRAKCDSIYHKNPGISWILDDEVYFTLSHSTFNGKSYFYSSDVSTTPVIIKYRQNKTMKSSYLSGYECPKRERDFVVDQPTYLDFIKRGIAPFIKEHHSGGSFKFWPDHSGDNSSNILVNYIEQKNINNIKNLKIQQMFQK